MKAFTKTELEKKLKDILSLDFSVSIEDASDLQIYKALAKIIVSYLKEKQNKFITNKTSEGKKQVYYISMEFLMGRSLKTDLYNLGINDIASEILAKYNIKLDSVCDIEPDAGLGNGGLGRLAACYLDGLATCEYPATGYSICYEYGIFKQKIIDGWQTELPDNWLNNGDVWLDPAPDQSVDVHFDGEIEEYWDNQYHHINHKNYTTVRAVPYDMYVPGYMSNGVSKLRLWKADAFSFDMSLFNKGDFANALGSSNIAHAISKVLYPNDNHLEGKLLRLRQQYFMCAASVGDITMKHMSTYGTMDNLADKVAIHVNDTHPTLAIPELMRILLDDCGYSWDKAWDITTKTFAYTNHTVMAEALEKWDKNLLQRTLPRIYSIIVEINNRQQAALYEKGADWGTVNNMSIIENNTVKMANLCVHASHNINGVSKLHSEIIKDEVFHNQYIYTPDKFTNVTNGIAYRRWLLQSNPGLTKLLEECIGSGFKKNGAKLAAFKKFENDSEVLAKLAAVKKENKERFAKYVKSQTGIVLNTDSIFDVQVKRLHEYKRQHLNALNIIAEYNYLLENPDADFVPKTYIFAAKAAPGYYLAKQIIKLIWSIGEEIRKNPKIREKLNVVYMEDYRVTLSEILMPASEISEQISLAGTEASGTGNMKLMLNGAVTIGTYDGANVEINEQVGDENIFKFGMDKNQVIELKARGYNPANYFE
ncbi:MAG: glycogen/starch/alpha-glucan phosphorylase, partial [Oscillospiraceae bacterium]